MVRAVRFAWHLGRIGGELSMARRHGRHARSGRGSDAGRSNGHEEQRLNWREKNADRDDYIIELDSKIVHLIHKKDRANMIKKGWLTDTRRVPGLDEWVRDHNATLKPKDQTKTLTADQIAKKLLLR